MAALPLRSHPLHRRLDSCLSSAADPDDPCWDVLAAHGPLDERDALLTLLAIHDLHLAPLGVTAGRERWQHHPVLAELKLRLEADLVDNLEADDASMAWSLPAEPVAALRAIAAVGLVPSVYRWLADEADRDEVVEFITLEGGPDDGFDDLVAACQVGLQGEAKVEMARNYWDEMGNGSPERVHRELHRKLARALDLPVVPREEQPLEGLRRSALGGLLATNRCRQPEMVGALGLIEMQAGPRCRTVVATLERLGEGDDALDFYREHAVADPRHGKGWLDNVVADLADDPRFAEGMVRGARWRSLVNAQFFHALTERFAPALIARPRAS